MSIPAPKTEDLANELITKSLVEYDLEFIQKVINTIDALEFEGKYLSLMLLLDPHSASGPR